MKLEPGLKTEISTTGWEDQCNDTDGFVVADFSIQQVKQEEGGFFRQEDAEPPVDPAMELDETPHGQPVAAELADLHAEDQSAEGNSSDGNSNECRVCRKMYSSPGARRRHQETHAMQRRPFACGQCGKAFQTRFNLKRHILVHTGARPFNCEVCDRGFAERGHLLVHRRIHTNERPFECSYCHWSFAHKPHVTEHERIHSGERPFSCGHCGKTFKRKTHRRSHERNVHKDFDN